MQMQMQMQMQMRMRMRIQMQVREWVRVRFEAAPAAGSGMQAPRAGVASRRSRAERWWSWVTLAREGHGLGQAIERRHDLAHRAAQLLGESIEMTGAPLIDRARDLLAP